MSNVPFVNLHVHSEYSLLDGLAHPQDLARRAKELGQPAVAVTDHGNLSGVIPFIEACRAEGVKPIVGCELYVTRGSRFGRPQKSDPDYEIAEPRYHLIALAQNEIGYRNLIKMNSLAFKEGMYYKPRVDHELLKQYNEGIFILSGCLGGELAKAIVSQDEDLAREVIEFYSTTFPGRYALEVQNHSIPDEDFVRRALIQLSEEYDLPLVATADNHFVYAEQAHAHEIVLCAQTSASIDDPKRFHFEGSGYHLASGEEMLELFKECPEAVSNTLKIAETCNLEFSKITSGLPIFPHLEPGLTSGEMLRKLCFEGLQQRYPAGVTPEIQQRAEMELKVINDAGFPDYFLIVWDLVHHAEQSGIKVAPGRGSAAGSIVSYALGITKIDPIKYNLLFERFLNPERVSMPDIDIDFQDRDAMIEYAQQTYGEDHVSPIVTFSRFKPRSAIRSIATVFGASPQERDALSKLVPATAMTIEQAVEESADLKSYMSHHAWTERVLEEAKTFIGYVSGISTNAAGVVISREPLLDSVPLQQPKGAAHKGMMITQFDKDVLGNLDFLKIDFLSNENLGLVKDTFDLVAQQYGIEIDMDHLPEDDPVTMAMLGRGDTIGVFQMEEYQATRILRELQPKTLHDIAAANALNRPGPLRGVVEEAGEKQIVDPATGGITRKFVPAKTVVNAYIERRHDPSLTQAPIPEVSDLLSETYGLILYQDQVMQIANHVAGYSLGEADILRAAMGKKNVEKMAHEHEKFIRGATERGVSEENAQLLWDYIEKFAGYGFNKAHAYAYGQLAYMTAWAKAHYPLQFFTALCNMRGGRFKKPEEDGVAYGNQRSLIDAAIRDAQNHGINVLPPNVNRSQADFSIASTARQSIIYGLAHIKTVSAQAVEYMVEERERNGEYRSLQDLIERNRVHGITIGAVRALYKKDKAAVDYMTLEEMVAQKLVRNDDEKEIVQRAIAEREKNGPYRTFAQVLTRNDLKTPANAKTWEALIRSGACDEFGLRRDLLRALPDIVARVKKLETTNGSEQLTLLDEDETSKRVVRRDVKLLTAQDLDAEANFLGMPLSGHRMDAYQEELAKRNVWSVERVLNEPLLPRLFRMAGFLDGSPRYREIRTGPNAGKQMAILKMQDKTGKFTVNVFSAAMPALEEALKSGTGPLLIEGNRMSGRGREEDMENVTISAQAISRLKPPVVEESTPTNSKVALVPPKVLTGAIA